MTIIRSITFGDDTIVSLDRSSYFWSCEYCDTYNSAPKAIAVKRCVECGAPATTREPSDNWYGADVYFREDQ